MTSTTSRKLRVLALVVAMIMSMTCLDMFGAAAAADAAVLTLEEIEEIGRLEAPATEAYREMLLSWVDDTNTVIYPNKYGGSYLRDDYKLVIKLVDGDSELQSSILSVVSNTDVLVFEPTDISRNELVQLMQAFDAPEGVRTFYSAVSFEKSALRVVIDKETVSAIPPAALLRTGSSHIIYEPIEMLTQHSGSGAPGDLLTAGNGVQGSVGWHGEYNFGGNQPHGCILTAGHVVDGMKGHKVTASDGATIITSTNFNNSLYCYSSLSEVIEYRNVEGVQNVPVYTGDFGFIRTSIERTNEVITGALAGNVAMTVPEIAVSNWDSLSGKTAYKSKGIFGYTRGTIGTNLMSDYTLFDNDYLPEAILQNSIEIIREDTVFSQPGDSGSAVYYYDNGYKILGIVCAGPSSPTSGRNSIVTAMSAIINAGFSADAYEGS